MLVIPSMRIELTTLGLLDPRSNQLSYEGTWLEFKTYLRYPLLHHCTAITTTATRRAWLTNQPNQTVFSSGQTLGLKLGCHFGLGWQDLTTHIRQECRVKMITPWFVHTDTGTHTGTNMGYITANHTTAVYGIVSADFWDSIPLMLMMVFTE